MTYESVDYVPSALTLAIKLANRRVSQAIVDGECEEYEIGYRDALQDALRMVQAHNKDALVFYLVA